MPFSMNKVIIIGRLGAEPEFRTSPQGVSLCRFRVATNERYRDRNGEWKEETEWHNVVAFGPLAETANRLLRKGHRVCVEGRNKTRSYEKNGVTSYITEIIARSIVYLESRGEREPVETQGYDEFADPTSYYINDIQSEPFTSSEGQKTEEEDDLPF
ncbi:MAG: single-stranded DNA-binding protein [Ignavibacteria bacterium]|nr:single-stranded DNA-binding protein [Ignavibacteria bacterium]